MEPNFRQKLNRGYADSTARGIEIALVPVVFGGIGWLLDGAAGTSPTFTIGFAVFAIVGMFVKLWLRYDADMAVEEAKMPWNRSRVTASPDEVSE